MCIVEKDGKQIEGIIFDLDGTLLDSMKIWDTIGNDYIESIGIKTDKDLSLTFKNMSMEQSADYYRNVYGVMKTNHEIISEINEMIREFYEKKADLKEGVRDFLEICRPLGISMCIATATSKELAEAALKRLEISHFFKDIVTCEEVGKGKDEPDIYERALELLNKDKEKVLVFEDALNGVKTAKQAGFFVVGVFDSHELEQIELEKTADKYIKGFKDMRL